MPRVGVVWPVGGWGLAESRNQRRNRQLRQTRLPRHVFFEAREKSPNDPSKHSNSTLVIMPASAVFLLALLVSTASAFSPPTRTSFATFNNAQTKELLRLWQPAPLPTSSGSVMLPASTENMKRFVRARILLEESPSLGCVASFDDALCVVLTRFSKAEHQLLLPLWQPNGSEPSSVFKDLVSWHKECFGVVDDAPRLSGSHLEADQDAWNDVNRPE